MNAYEEIGRALQLARREMRVTLPEAAEHLHIRLHYLAMLEAGKPQSIPGLIYAKGYLHSYASFLQLDADEVIRRFETEEAALKRGFYLPKTFANSKTPSPAIILGSMGVGILVYLLWSLAVSPPETEFSEVEAPPQKNLMTQTILAKEPCFRPQDSLYPPCYPTAPGWTLLPPQSQLKNAAPTSDDSDDKDD